VCGAPVPVRFAPEDIEGNDLRFAVRLLGAASEVAPSSCRGRGRGRRDKELYYYTAKSHSFLRGGDRLTSEHTGRQQAAWPRGGAIAALRAVVDGLPQALTNGT